MKLKNKQSFGIDEIPPVLIRMCATELAIPYSLLINQSFSEGVFPDSLKISLVKPIHKKGDTKDPNNYRPIALLPTSAKIFEMAMVKRIYSFYEKFNIFDDSQNGFRKDRSTTLAVYKYLQKVLDSIDNKEYAVGLLLDMSKAYDRVNYTILLEKLYATGIRGLPHKWFQSYLNNRSQIVEIQNTNFKTGKIHKIHSNKINIIGSIPQGSVLGCFLFLVYINNLPKYLQEQSIIFADDVSVLLQCKNITELNSKLDSTLNKIQDWLDTHNLKLNVSKTKIIEFKPYQKKSLKINYTYENNTIKTVDSATLLGIELDTHINWKPHIQKLSTKLSSFIYALRQLKIVTDFNTALSAYYAYAQSRLAYGIILWGNSTDVDKIFILQKKCIRILTGISNFDSCRPHFKKHSILTLTCLYILECCKFVRKQKHLFSPINTNKRNNRTQNQLQTHFSKLHLIHTGPHLMVIKIYNNIPNYIKNVQNNIAFIKMLKIHLINKCYYNMNEFFEDVNIYKKTSIYK